MPKVFRSSFITFGLISALALGSLITAPVLADDKPDTAINISPVSSNVPIMTDTAFDYNFTVTNKGAKPLKFEVYAAPYSYTYSELDGEYQLGFSHENNYTQIARWITFKDSEGNYVKRATFTAQSEEAVNISYRITTPSSLPNGGQYAVIFASAVNETSSDASSIKTEVSPGLIVYGQAYGETITSAEVHSLAINPSLPATKSRSGKSGQSGQFAHLNATSKVKNTGNIDFFASGKMKVEGLFGQVYYETPTNQPNILVIPESEISITDEWEKTPYFGLFKISWQVSAVDKTETISRWILLFPLPLIVISLMLLTIVLIWIIFSIRRHKERRARVSL